MTSPLVSAAIGVDYMIDKAYTEVDKATPGMVRKHRQFPGASPHHRYTGRDYEVSLDELVGHLAPPDAT